MDQDDRATRSGKISGPETMTAPSSRSARPAVSATRRESGAAPASSCDASAASRAVLGPGAENGSCRARGGRASSPAREGGTMTRACPWRWATQSITARERGRSGWKRRTRTLGPSGIGTDPTRPAPEGGGGPERVPLELHADSRVGSLEGVLDGAEVLVHDVESELAVSAEKAEDVGHVPLNLKTGVDDIDIRAGDRRPHAVQLRFDVESRYRLDGDVGRHGRVGGALVQAALAADRAVQGHLDLRLVHPQADPHVDHLQVEHADEELALEELEIQIALQVLTGGVERVVEYERLAEGRAPRP